MKDLTTAVIIATKTAIITAVVSNTYGNKHNRQLVAVPQNKLIRRLT